MKIDTIQGILQKFASNTIGFQGVAVVNVQGQPIASIGMDENATLTMASMMIYLTERTRKELGWEVVEQIDVKSADGYVILTTCSSDVLLLVKASKVPEGMLVVDINRTVEKLKIALEDDEDNIDSNHKELQPPVPINQEFSDTKSTSNDNHRPHPQMYRGSQVPA
ncbi:diacylglyceryl transferase [Scytonema sp. UIC 10036]|uniref:roadblock/LC7 domain-containing protein n=1 Tax=Scytonema sp. UIC 10036 TaxID=2304196 RepID=UPI0012DAA8E3|nr:roadblock/LC7 domain-containing protein [Scytonema sp. UIC 10036]MUG95705.1 diacylglyceryl transferase [Scytonema sp. UIC 10036]